MPSKATESKKEVRCAIYTRKSTDEGLEKEFNTLDAQREAGEAYIRSQKNEGWVCLPDTGMTMEDSQAGTWSGPLCSGCWMM